MNAVDIFWPYLGNCTVDENFIYENGEALFGVTGHVMIMGSSTCISFEFMYFRTQKDVHKIFGIFYPLPLSAF